MVSAKRTVLLVACLAALGWCWGQDTAQVVNDAVGEGKDKAESWAARASEVLSGKPGTESESAKDTAHKVADKTMEAVSKTSDALGSAAQETSKFASEKASQGVDSAKRILYDSDVEDKMRGAFDAAAEKAHDVAGKAQEDLDKAKSYSSDTANNINKQASERLADGKDEMKRASEAAKAKGDDAAGEYEATKGSMSERARRIYEAAKEKVSEATGNLGSRLGSGKEEAAEL